MSYRYLGNKTKLADWIVYEVSKTVPRGARIADPMCGTASVSMAFAEAGFAVTASDALTFPVIHARTRLLAKEAPEFKALDGYEGALRWMRNVEPEHGYFYREFGSLGEPENGRASRLYFTADNAGHIDALRSGIKTMRLEGVVDELEHSVLLQHLLLSTNKVANISGTYGYFRKSLSKAALRPMVFEPIDFVNTPGAHCVLQGTVEELAPTLKTDVVYLDPPYTKRQYAGNYHILETIAQEDEPVAAGDGGLRPWMDQASDFCYRRSAGNAFHKVLSTLNAEQIFVSYSEDGQVAQDELIEIFQSFGEVAIQEQPHIRYRSNRKVKEGSVLERLYHIKVA